MNRKIVGAIAMLLIVLSGCGDGSILFPSSDNHQFGSNEKAELEQVQEKYREMELSFAPGSGSRRYAHLDERIDAAAEYYTLVKSYLDSAKGTNDFVKRVTSLNSLGFLIEIKTSLWNDTLITYGLAHYSAGYLPDYKNNNWSIFFVEVQGKIVVKELFLESEIYLHEIHLITTYTGDDSDSFGVNIFIYGVNMDNRDRVLSGWYLDKKYELKPIVPRDSIIPYKEELNLLYLEVNSEVGFEFFGNDSRILLIDFDYTTQIVRGTYLIIPRDAIVEIVKDKGTVHVSD